MMYGLRVDYEWIGIDYALMMHRLQSICIDYAWITMDYEWIMWDCALVVHGGAVIEVESWYPEMLLACKQHRNITCL